MHIGLQRLKGNYSSDLLAPNSEFPKVWIQKQAVVHALWAYPKVGPSGVGFLLFFITFIMLDDGNIGWPLSSLFKNSRQYCPHIKQKSRSGYSRFRPACAFLTASLIR